MMLASREGHWSEITFYPSEWIYRSHRYHGGHLLLIRHLVPGLTPPGAVTRAAGPP